MKRGKAAALEEESNSSGGVWSGREEVEQQLGWGAGCGAATRSGGEDVEQQLGRGEGRVVLVLEWMGGEQRLWSGREDVEGRMWSNSSGGGEEGAGLHLSGGRSSALAISGRNFLRDDTP